MQNITHPILAAILSFAAISPTTAATIGSGGPGTAIGTLSTDNNSAFATWGQTLVTPGTDNQLNSFTLWIGPNFGSLAVKAYLAEWDNANNRIGSVLYTGPVVSIPNSNAVLQEIVFAGIDTAVSPMAEYIVFVSTLDAGAVGPTQFASVGVQNINGAGTDLYTSGKQRISNANSGGATIADLSNTNSWANTSSGQDLAFNATFSTVPEPSSVLLLSCTAGLLFRRSRRS